MSVFLILAALGIWGAVHSVLASLPVKAAVQQALGSQVMRFYRLGYNIFSVLSFAPVAWLLLALPDRPLYSVPAPWNILMMLGQAAGLLLLLVGMLQTDTLAFIGLRQLSEGEKEPRLVTGGLYRYARHPIYTAGLLALWLLPDVSLNRFTAMLGLSLYILIGATFEEKKLLREFGPAYTEYRHQTPMLIPGLRFWNEK